MVKNRGDLVIENTCHLKVLIYLNILIVVCLYKFMHLSLCVSLNTELVCHKRANE